MALEARRFPTRRQLVLGAAAGVGGALIGREVLSSSRADDSPDRPAICLFSKHLHHLDYSALARTVSDLGIPGVDLTVRPAGHVLPESVERDLPRAAAALEKQGIALPMISTGLTSAGNPAARTTLYTAAALGVPFFKLGYYRYRAGVPLDDQLSEVKRDAESLAALAQHAKIQGGFHNHSGTYVGAALWDHWWVLRDADPRWMGFYFDPCHATIEGGSAGWEIGFQRIVERLKMVAIKDFYWEKRGGEWKVRMCPLGEGMVNFPKFFEILAASGFRGPISLHMEYEIDAPSETALREKELAAIERDYQYLNQQVAAAFG